MIYLSEHLNVRLSNVKLRHWIFFRNIDRREKQFRDKWIAVSHHTKRGEPVPNSQIYLWRTIFVSFLICQTNSRYEQFFLRLQFKWMMKSNKFHRYMMYCLSVCRIYNDKQNSKQSAVTASYENFFVSILKTYIFGILFWDNMIIYVGV